MGRGAYGDSKYYGKTIETVARELQTIIETGLSQKEAKERLKRTGFNTLTKWPTPRLISLFFSVKQFSRDHPALICSRHVLLGEHIDAIVITFIVVLNSALGLIQESKAGHAIAAFKKMASPNALVIRGGQQVSIPERSWLLAILSFWRSAIMSPRI